MGSKGAKIDKSTKVAKVKICVARDGQTVPEQKCKTKKNVGNNHGVTRLRKITYQWSGRDPTSFQV